MSTTDHVYIYGYRRPSVTHTDADEIDGHRIGYKTRKDKLIPKATISYRPYCQCGWVARMVDSKTDYYVGTKKMAKILHNRHIKAVQQQGGLKLEDKEM